MHEMKPSLIYYCNYIYANVGVPGVYQSIIANIKRYYGTDVNVYGSDYEKYYEFLWSSDGQSIEALQVDPNEIGVPETAVFSAFDPYRKMVSQMLRWKRKNSQVIFWNWGYLTKQQCKGNWSQGKVPRHVKLLFTKIKRYTIAPLVDRYIVSGEAEMVDSHLDRQKCLLMPMGRPQSAILDACDEIPDSDLCFSDKAVTYIGRGQWKEKGISSIVDYAKTKIGENWLFRFFISSKDKDFDEQIKQNGSSNCEWYFDVFGKDNLPWLHKSAAFMTINLNPTQIRTPYEALYAGTPIVMLREGFMDGFKEILDAQNLNDAVQILESAEFNSMSFKIKSLSQDDRVKLMSIMRIVLDSREFTEWFVGVLMCEGLPASYYSYISERLSDRV